MENIWVWFQSGFAKTKIRVRNDTVMTLENTYSVLRYLPAQWGEVLALIVAKIKGAHLNSSTNTYQYVSIWQSEKYQPWWFFPTPIPWWFFPTPIPLPTSSSGSRIPHKSSVSSLRMISYISHRTVLGGVMSALKTFKRLVFTQFLR